jgi:hypothetical protein
MGLSYGVFYIITSKNHEAVIIHNDLFFFLLQFDCQLVSLLATSARTCNCKTLSDHFLDVET